MNRRRFIELLTSATIGSTVAYSFPSIIVPKNIVRPECYWKIEELGPVAYYELPTAGLTWQGWWYAPLSVEQIVAQYEAARANLLDSSSHGNNLSLCFDGQPIQDLPLDKDGWHHIIATRT